MAVVEHPVLALCCRQTCAYVADHLGDIAEKESSPIQASSAAIRRRQIIESVVACASVVARYAQIHSVTNIGSELELVVAVNLGDITDPLELLLAFKQRTIAATHAQAIPPADRRRAIDTRICRRAGRGLIEQESAPSGSKQRLRACEIRVRYAHIGHRRRADVWLVCPRVIFEISEAKIAEE